MAINEWKIWQNLGITKPRREQVKIDDDLDAINMYLKDLSMDTKKIYLLIREIQLLRQKEQLLSSVPFGHTVSPTTENEIKKCIEQQIAKWDELLKHYYFFKQDADINGVRLKKISKLMQSKAEKFGISEKLLEKIRKDPKWTFNW